MVIIRVKKRLKSFDIDATLKFGPELTVLTGANGSGKTMLLRLVAGIEKPDEGFITVMGRCFLDEGVHLTPEERRVGYASQRASLFPWLTIEDNIRFGIDTTQRRSAKNAEVERWLEELTERLEVAHLLGRYPALLSGGEAQRVALARALAPRPALLLLDEPLSAVDVEMRPRLRAFIREIQQEWRIPVVMVSHDPAEAHTMGDRIFTIEEGKITSQRQRGSLGKSPLFSY